jgi:hypothetical protein
MEDAHKAAFVEMQQGVTEAEKSTSVFDPNDESYLYLAAMADSHGGEGSPSAANALTGKETMEEILIIAIRLEKEYILFYLGLRDLVPQIRSGKSRYHHKRGTATHHSTGYIVEKTEALLGQCVTWMLNGACSGRPP